MKGLKENVVLGGIILVGTGFKKLVNHPRQHKNIHLEIKKKNLFEGKMRDIKISYSEESDEANFWAELDLNQRRHIANEFAESIPINRLGINPGRIHIIISYIISYIILIWIWVHFIEELIRLKIEPEEIYIDKNHEMN